MKGKRKIVHGAGGVTTQLRQVCIDYASMVNPRDITLDEIRYFYSPLLDGLCERQKRKYGE